MSRRRRRREEEEEKKKKRRRCCGMLGLLVIAVVRTGQGWQVCGGVVTGGDGGQSEPGICDGGTTDPPMIRCHPGGFGMVRYGMVIYITRILHSYEGLI